jgi:hypothetical protein
MSHGWTDTDNDRVIERLRDLLGQGQSIEEAIASLHRLNGIGLLLLCPAVETIGC